jgi:hypothetical protein
MKRYSLIFSIMLCSVVYAGQIAVINKTNKDVVLSLVFFHTQAQKEMKIKDFSLKSMEKTKFPQDKDRDLAQLLKLKVRTADGASVSMTFEKDDIEPRELEIIERDGQLRLISKNPTIDKQSMNAGKKVA